MQCEDEVGDGFDYFVDTPTARRRNRSARRAFDGKNKPVVGGNWVDARGYRVKNCCVEAFNEDLPITSPRDGDASPSSSSVVGSPSPSFRPSPEVSVVAPLVEAPQPADNNSCACGWCSNCVMSNEDSENYQPVVVQQQPEIEIVKKRLPSVLDATDLQCVLALFDRVFRSGYHLQEIDDWVELHKKLVISFMGEHNIDDCYSELLWHMTYYCLERQMTTQQTADEWREFLKGLYGIDFKVAEWGKQASWTLGDLSEKDKELHFERSDIPFRKKF